MKERLLIAALCIAALCPAVATAQTHSAERCLGVWEGKMLIYRESKVIETVPIKLTVARAKTAGDFTWKTEYFSPTRPMTQDYVLRVKDLEKGVYVTDEGGGVELADYLHGDKLYNVFEVQGVMLTATYELRGEELIFEVTSGKKLPDEKAGVVNYSVVNLQRAVLKRASAGKVETSPKSL